MKMTLATLFDRRVDTLGLTADFPKDNTSHHMDTIGESLVTSGFLLDQYFQAASRLVETRLGKPAMKPKSWHFTDNFRQYEELTGAHQSVFKFRVPLSLRAAQHGYATRRLWTHRGFPGRRPGFWTLRY